MPLPKNLQAPNAPSAGDQPLVCEPRRWVAHATAEDACATCAAGQSVLNGCHSHRIDSSRLKKPFFCPQSDKPPSQLGASFALRDETPISQQLRPRFLDPLDGGGGIAVDEPAPLRALQTDDDVCRAAHARAPSIALPPAKEGRRTVRRRHGAAFGQGILASSCNGETRADLFRDLMIPWKHPVMITGRR